MKRVLIASLFSLAAAPVFATTPSFNDFPEQGQLEAAPTVAVSIAPSFNDQPDLEAAKANGTAGLAGRAAAEIAQPAYVYWTPY
jgi:hypothetical protein